MENEIYNRNIACIRVCYPGLIKDLEIFESQIEQRPDNDVEVEVLQGRKGMPTFIVKTKSGATIHGHSIFDPVRDAEKKYGKENFSEKERIILLGFGFGYEVRYILSRLKHCAIVVVEPFVKVFRKALETVDLTDIFSSGKIVFTLSINPHELKYILIANTSYLHLPDITPRVLPHTSLFPQLTEVMETAVKESKNFMLMNMATGIGAGAVLNRNTAENFHYVVKCPGITNLGNSFKDKPIFIIAPGPSLDGNADQLKRVKGKALIIACDTAVKPLLRHGVQPDCIVSIDFQPLNYFKMRGIDTSFAYYFPAIETTPYIPQNHKGRMFFYAHNANTEMIFAPIFGRRGTISTGGSVLTDAFSLAGFFGANPIVFVGADLGFPNMRWYADGGFNEEKYTGNIKTGDTKTIEVKDIYGNPMQTYDSFFEFITWFGLRIPRHEGTVIDATEGGAKIEGTIIMNLSDVIDKYVVDDVTPLSVIDAIYEMYVPPEREKMLAKIEEYIVDYNGITETMTKGLKSCRRITELLSRTKQVMNNKEVIRLLQRINEARKIFDIDKQHEHLSFLAHAMEKQMAAIYYNQGEKDDTSKERILELVALDKNLYSQIEKACENLKMQLEYIREEMLLEEDVEFV